MAESLVVDASVAAKWFLRDELEGDVDLAEGLLGALLEGLIEIHAPQVFRHEVCGLLTKACLTKRPQGEEARLEKQDAIDRLRDFFDLPIQIHDMTVDEGIEALAMAVDYHKGHYDMAYVCLARRLNCPWCTADEKFLQAVPSGFPSQYVLPLSALRQS